MNCNIYCIYISNAGCFDHVQCGVCSIWAIEYSCRRIWRLRLRVSEYPRAKLPTPFIACHLRCTPPLVPLLQPPLCRPEHEYFAQNAVCYITHIIIGKSRQRILSPRTHTHAHIWRAGSLANANDPTHFGPTPTHPAGTYVAVAAPAAAAEAEVRTRSRTWASCTPPTLLPPSSLPSYASAVLHYSLPPSAFGQSACGRF